METVFSKQLKKLRKENNVTQEALANHLNVSPQAISKWENGSYPDGDLLPKIADFFSVSIDYLYGRDQKDTRLEARVFDEFRKIVDEGDMSKDDKVFKEKIFEVMWAILISAWKGNKYYYPRPIAYDKNIEVTVSNICSQSGFSLMRLNSDLEYFFVAKEPEERFGKRLNITEKMYKLFEFLSDRSNVKILHFMLTLSPSTGIRAKTLSQTLGISKEKVENALDFLSNGDVVKNIVSCGGVLDEQGNSEKIYILNFPNGSPLLMLFITAELMTNTPQSFHNQICSRNEVWFKREDLDYLKKEGDKNVQEK